MALETYYKHYFYRRYLWKAADFEKMQDSEFGVPEGLAEGLLQGAVVKGFDEAVDDGLDLVINAGIAFNDSGEMVATEEDKTVTLTGDAAGVKNLIVARLVKTDIDTITKPTDPFDTVPLREQYEGTVVCIAGTPGGGWPAPLAGDIPLLGVETNASSVTAYDWTKCQLVGKVGELRHLARANVVVANTRWGTVRSLAEAVLVAGDRVRVAENQTANSVVTVSVPNVRLEFDPGVRMTKGSAASGIIIAASGCLLRGGEFRDFSTASDVPIGLTAAASGCVVADTVLLNCRTSQEDKIVDLSTGFSGYGNQAF